MAITGKNISDPDVAVLPSAYKLQEIVITNIAVKMSITESIYSQSLVLNLTLKDSLNFVEEFPLIGQEKIQVKIEYSRKGGNLKKKTYPKSLDLSFYITEYPIFGSAPMQAYTQVIRLVGISEQSYISNQKKIVKSYDNNTAEEIEQILKTELNLDVDKKFKSDNKKKTSGRGTVLGVNDSKEHHRGPYFRGRTICRRQFFERYNQ